MCGQRGLDAVIDDCLCKSSKRLWDVVISETYRDRISPEYREAGEGGVQAKQPRGTGQQVGTADVGDKPDAHFGHGDLRGVSDHANAGVRTEPNAPAHDDAVHQRHDSFGVPG